MAGGLVVETRGLAERAGDKVAGHSLGTRHRLGVADSLRHRPGRPRAGRFRRQPRRPAGKEG